MDKQKINKIVDSLMFVVFLAVMLSGIIIPDSGHGNAQVKILGMARHSWAEIHEWSAVVLSFLVFAHIMLHWEFIVYSTKNIFKKNNSPEENKNI